MTEEEFEVNVRDLRTFQRRFFAGDKESIGPARRLERLIDAELARRADARKKSGKTLLDLIDELEEPPTERQLGALE